MAINNFKPFAIGSGANVTSQGDYESLPALVTGFQSGKASSAQINKALRQSSFVSSALAQFISDKLNQDVLDNGDLSAFNFKLAQAFASQYLSRSNPFADIKADGTAAIALANLGLGDGSGRLINAKLIISSGQYTPTTGTKRIMVYIVGGGGGGGGTYTTNSTQVSIGAGGGAGGLSVSSLLVSNLTLPVQITIGSAGSAGGIASAGGAGGTTSFGGLLSATGGSGGDTGRLLSSSSTSITFSGGGGSGSGGNIYNAWGGSGMRGFATPGGLESGEGGASYFTAGAGPITAAVSTAGGSGTLGSGGSGGFTPVGSSERIGGAGGSGAVLILEYA